MIRREVFVVVTMNKVWLQTKNQYLFTISVFGKYMTKRQSEGGNKLKFNSNVFLEIIYFSLNLCYTGFHKLF